MVAARIRPVLSNGADGSALEVCVRFWRDPPPAKMRPSPSLCGGGVGASAPLWDVGELRSKDSVLKSTISVKNPSPRGDSLHPSILGCIVPGTDC